MPVGVKGACILEGGGGGQGGMRLGDCAHQKNFEITTYLGSFFCPLFGSFKAFLKTSDGKQ